MRVITVKGYKKTGKTATCIRLIEELTRRGYSVGSVKNTHFPGFCMDTPNTDSYRHAEAGASTVVVVSGEETDVVFRRRVELSEVIDLYTEDFLVSEGDGGMPFANIVTGKTTADLDARRDEHTIGFAGIIAEELTSYDGLPVINAMTDVGALADLVIAGASEYESQRG